MDGDGDTEAENVIRLPRDWVGPPEELVPLGSRARAARPAGSPADKGDHRDVIADAGDFWGETASAVHHVMRAPTEAQAAGPAHPRRHRPRRARIHRRTAAIATVVAVIGLIAVVAIVGMSQGHGSGSTARATAAARARLQESATTSDPTTTRQDHHDADRAARARPRAVPLRALSERPSARHIAGRRHQARRGAPSTRHATTRHPQSGIATAVATPVATAPPTTTTTTPVVASSTTSTVVPTTATTARDGTGTSAATAERTPSPSAGPLGPGDASGCDPKCS